MKQDQSIQCTCRTSTLLISDVFYNRERLTIIWVQLATLKCMWNNWYHGELCTVYLHNLDKKSTKKFLEHTLLIQNTFLYQGIFVSPSYTSSIGYKLLLILITDEFPFCLLPFWADNNGVISALSRYGLTLDCLRNFATNVLALCDIISFQYITVGKSILILFKTVFAIIFTRGYTHFFYL